ncbi:MBL fold metallo-hydrolase [Candidatus Fermentibacteria bacterium]|nr:MBL fold metallo-hydrolase [Candidatus Fermentibacteria bacterium]
MTPSFYSWGACQEVTGSKHFVDTGRHTLMIDCGMFQGRRQETYERNATFPFDPSAVDALILTHAHFDHSGNLPTLVKEGFAGTVYCTPATRDLTNLILLDSAHIQRKDAEFAHKRSKGFVPDPLYDEEDVAAVMDRMVTIGYDRPFPVPGGTATFLDAGHILGSSLVVLSLDGGPIIGLTGDIGRPHLPILRDPQLFPRLDFLVSESTYGDRLHGSLPDLQRRLAEVLNRAVTRGGKVIIPAFAVERTQEIIYCLHLLKDQHAIPVDLPMFVDSPMAISATGIFRMHPECFDKETRQLFRTHERNPFGFEGLHYIRHVEDSKALNNMSGPMVIISASGMCEAGRILHHLRNNIANPANIILIVGFMAENTLGRRLVEGHKEVNIFGEPHAVEAEVEIMDAFSAHADYREMGEYLGRLDRSRLKEIFLVHGEESAQEPLRKRLVEQGFPLVTIAQYESTYSLDR